MPPRVLILTPTLLHSRAEINPRAIRSERLIAGLAALGFEVDVASWWAGGGEPTPPAGARRLYTNDAGNPTGRIANTPRRLLHRALRYTRSDRDRLTPWAEQLERELAAGPADQLPDVILAIAVPVGAINAGVRLGHRFGIPVVADLGDPWLTRGPAEARTRSHSLGAADALITTTPELAAELGPFLRADVPLLLAPAGGELRSRTRTRPADAPPLFVHLGVITEGRVAPEPAFDQLARLDREGRIEFRSHSGGFYRGLHDLPQPHLDPLPHARAIDLLAEASAALVLGNRNRAQLPSKAFEIACTETWALCVSELDDDPTATVLRASGHGVIAANDPASIAAATADILAREARGELPTPDPAQSWDRRCEQVAGLLEAVALRGRSG